MSWTVLYVSSAAISVVTAALAFSRRRRVPAARAFAVVPLSHAAWTVLQVAELGASGLGTKLVLDAAQWLAGLGVAVGGLWFAREYAGRPVRPWVWRLLVAAPLPLVVVLVTVPLHRWVHRDAWLSTAAPGSGAPTVLEYSWSMLDWLLLLYGYVLITASIGLVARRLVHQHPAYVRQGVFVLVGLAAPPLASLLALAFQIRIYGERDPTAVVFGVSDLMVTYGLLRQQLFDLGPVARDALVSELADGIVVTDRDSRVVDVNRAFCNWLGLTARDVLGDAAAAALAAWPVLVQVSAGALPRGELAIAGEGGTHWLDVTATALSDNRGRRIGYATVLRDVTDRLLAQRALALRTERALHDTEQRFRAIIDHTFELIALLDTDGRLLVANRAALEFAGIDAAAAVELVGRSFWDTPWWAHAHALGGRLRAAVRAAAAGNFVRFEATHLACGNERPRYIDFSLKAVHDERGQVVLLVAEGRDVTELRLAERENATLGERLQQARRQESMGRLAGGLAHDFNNLLTAVMGSVDVARAALPAAPEIAPALDVIQHAAESGAELTRRLLAFGRPPRGSVPQAIAPAAALATVTPLLARLVGDAVALSVRADPDAWPIRLDRNQLEQVLVNLAINARDAMPEGGRLTIVAENLVLERARRFQTMEAGPAAYLQLRISDTGVGMSEAVLGKIFEPFYTTKHPGKGTGLGLSVVYGIVEQGGGYLEVSSRVGQGTEVRLLFPRAAVLPDDAGLVVEAAAAAAAPDRPPVGALERVLVVEDQPAVRAFLSELLDRLGYDVSAFADGEAALEAAAAADDRGPAALLIADVVLPGKSGVELADDLRQRWPGMKVLLVSGYSDETLVRYELGGDVHFMAKPFRATALAEKVRTILDGGLTPGDGGLTPGGGGLTPGTGAPP
jgi:PAS domain S-box-containing protein